ncbi:hypothetical protein P9112_004317 [Eukaryota sp. TZLM1-RC]
MIQPYFLVPRYRRVLLLVGLAFASLVFLLSFSLFEQYPEIPDTEIQWDSSYKHSLPVNDPPPPPSKPSPTDVPPEPPNSKKTKHNNTNPNPSKPILPSSRLSVSKNPLPPGKKALRGGQIDAVVTFVNGSDPSWQKARKDRLRHLGHAATAEFQWRDNNELVYCLRGLYSNVPQLRHIFLVVASPSQVPPWLNTNDPYISIVYHDELFTTKSYLPTFSSYAIEANLWRIPYLSDDFIYLNDDFFIVNTLPDDLIRDSEGFAQIHIDHTKINRPINQFRRGLINAGRILTRRFGRPKSINSWYALSHTFYVCNRQVMEETAKEFPKAYNDLQRNPFRTPSGLPHFIFLSNHFWVQKTIEQSFKGHHKAKYHKCHGGEYIYWNFHTDDDYIHKNQQYFDRIETRGVVSICINDDKDRTDEQQAWINSKLLKLFPDKAIWEK